MTTQEFWNKYLNEDIVDIFEDIYEFFSKELPKEFLEEYEEVLLETEGHLEQAKEFDKLIKFTELLQEKYPKIYDEFFEYYNKFLVDYHTFYGNREEVHKAFSKFIEKPIESYDNYFESFLQLVYYDSYHDLLAKAIDQNFEEVADSPELIGGAEFELAMAKYYSTLEHSYKPDENKFEKNKFIESIKKIYFRFDENSINTIEKYLLNENNNVVQTDSDSRIIIDRFALEVEFLKLK